MRASDLDLIAAVYVDAVSRYFAMKRPGASVRPRWDQMGEDTRELKRRDVEAILRLRRHLDELPSTTTAARMAEAIVYTLADALADADLNV